MTEPDFKEPAPMRPPTLVALAAPLAVGLCLGGLLFGYAPVGDDPDALYRPIKGELARALRSGTLPFWTDRLGLGMPLMAESHVAALYPPNLLFYRFVEPGTASRWLMWLHYVALAVTTYILARDLGLSGPASSLASLSFALSGFMAGSASLEPFYTAMPYLPLGIVAARRYAATGKAAWLAAVALVIGVQLTVGHFHMQLWTICLSAAAGVLRAQSTARPRLRVLGLALGMAWGMMIGSTQLFLTAELVQITGFSRNLGDLTMFALPPALLAEPTAPWLFLGQRRIADASYWSSQATSPLETCWYIGTLPLALAILGFLGVRRGFLFWMVLVPLSLALACLPKLSPTLFQWITQIPGLGTFRAPGRYRLLATLALCLLAGAGVDRSLSASRLRFGTVAILVMALAGPCWGLVWSRSPLVRPSLASEALTWGPGLSVLSWGLSLGALWAWRRGRLGLQVLWALTAVELGLLFYQAPPRWAQPEDSLARSPILNRLAGEPGVGLVVGSAPCDVPMMAGLSPSNPYLGITLPPPNDLLRLFAQNPPALDDTLAWRRARRYGVTHGIYRDDDARPVVGTVLLVSTDPLLDDFRQDRSDRDTRPARWRLEHYPDAAPPALVVTNHRVAPDWISWRREMNKSDESDVAWYCAADAPPEGPGAPATTARLVHWDGASAVVDHDGACDLILRRGYYPGWSVRVGENPWEPVHNVNGDLQGVRINGRGPTQVQFRYRPTYWTLGATLSLLTGAAAIATLVTSWLRRK